MHQGKWHRDHHENLHHDKGDLHDAPATVRVHGTAIGAIGIGNHLLKYYYVTSSAHADPAIKPMAVRP